MKHLKAFAYLPAVLLLFISCEVNDTNDDCIHGDGTLISRDYSISDFDKISVFTVADVYVKKAASTTMIIEGEENVLDALNVKVSGGKLSLGEGNCFKDIEPLQVYVSTASLSSIQHTGVGSISGSGSFSGEEFKATINGAADIRFNVDVQNLKCTINGTGDMVFAGNTDSQSLEINGVGSFSNFDLEGREAKIVISGSGNSEVTVSDALDVIISGVGNVYYKGNPSIHSQISGIGNVMQKE